MLWESVEVIRELREIKEELRKYYHHQKYHLYIIWKGPSINMSSVTLNITPPYGNNVGVPVETKNGQPFTFDPATINWAVQDSSVVSFVKNADGSAIFTPLKVGSTDVAVQDSVTLASATGTISVEQSVDTFSMTITWKAAS